MNWYLVIKFLHILAVAFTIGGMFARQTIRGIAGRSDDIKTIYTLSRAATRIDRGIVIPASNIMIVVGVVLALMSRWPILGFLQGAPQNWLLVSNILLVFMVALIPTVFVPHNKNVAAVFETAMEKEQVTPELTAALGNKLNQVAHIVEEIIILAVAALMVLKPF